MAQVERKLTELGVDVNHRSIFLLLVWIWVPTVAYAVIFFLYDLIVYVHLSISFRLWFFEVMYSWSQNIGIIVLLDFMAYVRYVAHFNDDVHYNTTNKRKRMQSFTFARSINNASCFLASVGYRTASNKRTIC